MSKIRNKIREKRSSCTSMKAAFYNEEGAIDLASIMVGVIVIGLIGGVIAATVFTVIPWSQDNAAKQQLESIHTAQNAYFGLTSDPSRPLAAEEQRNSFTNSAGLATANLLSEGTNYCATPISGGKDYRAYAKSASGKVFTATNSNKRAVPVTEVITDDCSALSPANIGVGSGSGDGPAAYVDPTPTKTILTYKCDSLLSGVAPFKNIVQGTLTVTGDDATSIVKDYSNKIYTDSISMKAGVTYTVTFDGSYSAFATSGSSTTSCIRSLDHWGEQSGVVSASYGLANANNLTSVPEHIPSTVNNLSAFFFNATSINDENISKWDVSNVTTFNRTFYGAKAFNQNLNKWDVSNATTIEYMFGSTDLYDQPMNEWDTSNITNMRSVFMAAKSFNQSVNDWEVSQVTDMSEMFYKAAKFDQPLNKWNVSNVTAMESMFRDTTKFNQDISAWKPAKVTDIDSMFAYNSVFRYNLSSWTFNTSPARFAWAPTGFPTAYYPTF